MTKYYTIRKPEPGWTQWVYKVEKDKVYACAKEDVNFNTFTLLKRVKPSIITRNSGVMMNLKEISQEEAFMLLL